MKALDIAYAFVNEYGTSHCITNLKLNKLVYFAQVLSLKKGHGPLFDDEIEAWEYGPVVRSVYREFKRFGSRPIAPCKGRRPLDKRSSDIVVEVMASLGGLSAFDLVEIAHKKGGAWERAYYPGADNVISDRLILDSDDLSEAGKLYDGSFAEAVYEVEKKWPNALRLLEDA